MLNDLFWHRVLPLCLGVLLFGTDVRAQHHFDDCAHRTESNATLILPDSLNLKIDGQQAKGEFEVAVYTPDNRCAGRSTWNGEAVALTAWGAAPTSPSKGRRALQPGDSIHVRLYDSTCGVEYNRYNSRVTMTLRDEGPPSVTDPLYAPDGIYVLEEIVLHSLFLSSSESCPRRLTPQVPPSFLHPKADSGIAQSHTAAKQN